MSVSTRARWRCLVAGCAAAGLALSVSACGSSSPTSSGSSGSTASTASTGSGSGADVAAAAAAVKKAEQAPTRIGVAEPLKSAPPKGKTFVWLQCNFTQCTQIGDGVKAAAQAIGWNFKVIPYKSEDPATLVSGFRQALSADNPTAVGLSGIPVDVWSSVLPAYKQAGVPIVASYVGPTPIGDPIIANVSGPEAKKAESVPLTNWLVADSHGKGHVLLQRADDFTIYKSGDDIFEADVKRLCPGCQVTNLAQTIPDVQGGKTVPAIVSALKRDPSIDYVFTSNGSFIPGLPAALKAAGVANRVKIFGFDPTVENVAAVKSGTEQAFTPSAQSYAGWLIMDATLRHLQSIPLPAGYGETPVQLLTKDADFTVTGDYPQPVGYQDQFKQLWKVK
ncbi:MAG: hypothetical protein JWQ48_1161 [Conexibacter sp.]|nr:hypothetical protein [Conexibacter sp.]